MTKTCKCGELLKTVKVVSMDEYTNGSTRMIDICSSCEISVGDSYVEKRITPKQFEISPF